MVYDFLATCDVRSMALRTTNFLDPKKRQHKIDDSLISKGHQNRSLWERLCTLRNLFYFSEIKSFKNRLEPLAFPGGFLVVAPRAFFSIFHFFFEKSTMPRPRATSNEIFEICSKIWNIKNLRLTNSKKFSIVYM